MLLSGQAPPRASRPGRDSEASNHSLTHASRSSQTQTQTRLPKQGPSLHYALEGKPAHRQPAAAGSALLHSYCIGTEAQAPGSGPWVTVTQPGVDHEAPMHTTGSVHGISDGGLHAPGASVATRARPAAERTTLTLTPTPALQGRSPRAALRPPAKQSHTLARSTNTVNFRAGARSSLHVSALQDARLSGLPALLSTLGSQTKGRGSASPEKQRGSPAPGLVMKKVY